MSKMSVASKLYADLAEEGAKESASPAQQKKINAYVKFIDKNATDLIKMMKKQGHTPHTRFYTMIKFVESVYGTLGVYHPMVSLPKPNFSEEEQNGN